jgi:exonuclease III
VVAKGEDPFGLGRWSYITFQGKDSVKVTIVTAYNATPSPGDCTYYHQQLRVISRLQREQNIHVNPDPRRQFILDLQSWLESLAREGHQFILALDANAVYDPDHVTQQHPLEYREGFLTVNSTHDGKLATLVATCNLCLPLARQHTTRPFPASHIMGRNQIDYILVSQTLLPAVQRSGVLSHHLFIKGDHRPYYLDFDASLLFSDPAYQIEPAFIRKLRLQDPRVIQSYSTALHTSLEHHNVFSRLDKLQGALDRQEWTSEHTAEYELLDRTITEAMLQAEKDISKRITTTYQWSPKLKQAVQHLRYWNLRLRQAR